MSKLTKEPPKVTMDGQYFTMDACRVLGGVSKDSFRRWRRNLNLPVHIAKSNGKRFYYGRELLMLWRARA